MSFDRKKITTMMALFLVFAVTQVYIGISLAAPTTGPSDLAAAGVPQATAILTTQGNKPINVNGANAISGATILSGAAIQTPDGVTATVNIPGHGVLEIGVNTKLTLVFDQNGNVMVNIIQGCAVLHTRKGTRGEIDNAQGVVGKTDGTKDDVIEVCPGVKIAGATAAGAGGLFGLGTAATVLIIGAGVGTGVGILIATRGGNPSPAVP